uniref:Ribosome biogenesis protein BOP1 homolog n=1 Tax=Eucampia antarctica TaxID=49252 RepID=A0A7S2RGP5_9STRA|mmetsp:Transcript_21960/g.21097  ORF Transcript_21960/g.21097 Transcript_21960/m.21097 type:complete len:908 (+) Transcript_21960:32-2755(+)
MAAKKSASSAPKKKKIPIMEEEEKNMEDENKDKNKDREIENDEDESSSSVSVYDSADDYGDDDDDDDEDAPDGVSASDDSSDDDDEEDGDFEDQGSSDEEDLLEQQADDGYESSDDELEVLDDGFEETTRQWKKPTTVKRGADGKAIPKPTSNTAPTHNKDDHNIDNNSNNNVDSAESREQAALWMHTDDLSSDDEDADGTQNRIGRVPLHWYDEYDHIGYDAHGKKVIKQSVKDGTDGGDLLDQVIQNQEDRENKKFVVHDALNAKDVELTPRQIQLIRRVQAGAYAHPEHNANPDYIDYFSGVNKEISGLNSDRHEPKARFQPSKYEKMQVRRLLHKLDKGEINMDYLTGKVRDMNDVKRKHKQEGDHDKPYMLWKGDKEDDPDNYNNGPQHIAAPKLPPPGHAESYNPSEEYLPTEEELKEWEEMDPKDRPYGLLIPKKFPNLRSVGAYEHSVRERFERCLDLYLCSRVMKRRLNIDPESLIPSIPKASDLRPFPTSQCIRYETPYPQDDDNHQAPPMIRCITVSPDGQFMASGASDGFVRLWEVQTGRLLRSWNLSALISVEKPSDTDEKDDTEEKQDQDQTVTPKVHPIVSLQWNPNRSHHCLIAAVGPCAVVIATGTAGVDDSEFTEALLAAASSCREGKTNVKNTKAAKAVQWIPLKQKQDVETKDTMPISAFGGDIGPIVALRTTREMNQVKWHRKGDYFLTVSPKAGASSVLIHQLSKANSQQPFSKAKGDAQCACFHPNKPFLFVANQQHVRVYNLMKQKMVKRLLTGCKWISCIDVHPTGDHIILGSLDRRMIWLDLDLSNMPYKTLKYHERAIRSVGFHPRYPLMASSSDDGSVHVFHSTVYSDLMRNPLVVPVKILKGHTQIKKLGVLSMAFHPTQPWLFSAGADGKIHLYQDI